jgi:hypothetical protein
MGHAANLMIEKGDDGHSVSVDGDYTLVSRAGKEVHSGSRLLRPER